MSYEQKVIERLGSQREVEPAKWAGPLVPRAEAQVPEGFVDLSAGLQCGIYALVLRGQVVFIGKGKVPLELVALHRSRAERPSWMGPQFVEFDRIWVKPSHPDRLEAELAELVEKYKPRLQNSLSRFKR